MVSRQEVINTIKMQLQQRGFLINRTVTIEDAPNYIRHSCLNTGVTLLYKQVFNVTTETGVIPYPYYYCSSCGTLYLYRFLYD